MVKWCGIQKSIKTNRYRIIVPMMPDFIGEDMMVSDNVGGKILTRWLNLDEAKNACKEFNMLHEKWN